MGELTSCNYCTLKRVKRQAKEEGKKVVVKPGDWHKSPFGSPGKDIFVDDKKVAWFAELTGHCVC